MDIGVDIRSLLEPQRSGVGEYTFELLSALFRIDQTNNYHLFANVYKYESIDHFLPTIRSNRITVHRFRYPNKLMNAGFRFLNIPKIDQLLGRLDLFFIPNVSAISISPSIPTVLTIHDLSFEHYPSFFTPLSRWRHRIMRRPKTLAENATHILAVSEYTKTDVVNHYSIPSDRITVTKLGVHPRFFETSRNEELQEVRERYHLPSRFILFLATLEPRKNVPAAIEAFSLLRQQPEYQDLHLVLAGRCARDYHPLDKDLNKVHLLDYVRHEDRPIFYQLAEVFIYPSFYEGFGLPPLEAMAAGTPVIASHTSSIGEVAGNSCLLIDPYNTKDLHQALRLMLNDQALRQKFIQRGQEQAKKFQWDETARKTLAVFQKIGNQ